MANAKAKAITKVDTKAVKVVFNTSSKDFTATMSKFYLALSEMNDKKLIYAKNLRSAQSWLNTLEENNKDGKNDEKIVAQKSEIEEMKSAQSVLTNEINARIKECYALIPDTLYTDYVNGKYAKAVEDFFKAQNIECTDSLKNFMVKTVGLRCASAKVMFKQGTTLDFQTKTTFQKLFMSTLAQLMLDKNALKLDMYKWEYVPEEKTTK